MRPPTEQELAPTIVAVMFGQTDGQFTVTHEDLCRGPIIPGERVLVVDEHLSAWATLVDWVRDTKTVRLDVDTTSITESPETMSMTEVVDARRSELLPA